MPADREAGRPAGVASAGGTQSAPVGTSEAGTAPLLAVDSLRIAFPAGGGLVDVVEEASFTVDRREFVGLVGESGSGKTVTALALLRLVPPPGRIRSGRILLDGEDLLDRPERTMTSIRGARIGFVFQEPMTALNPVFTIGNQIVEAIRAHAQVSRRQARGRALELLELVAMPEPHLRLKEYPHNLSGGQRQRVMIAIALASEPDLLIADEPTTALDVTVQAQILELLEDLRSRLGLAVLLITHDLAVVAETCSRVLVMYAGRIVEEAPVQNLFEAPAHPYTRGLLASLPRLGRAPESGPDLGRGRLQAIPGQVPDLASWPAGCRFHPRCPERFDPCSQRAPGLAELDVGRRVACFLHSES